MGPIMFNIFINYLDNRAEALKPQTGFQVEGGVLPFRGTSRDKRNGLPGTL